MSLSLPWCQPVLSSPTPGPGHLGHPMKWFMANISSSHHNTPIREALLLSPFYRRGAERTEARSHEEEEDLTRDPDPPEPRSCPSEAAHRARPGFHSGLSCHGARTSFSEGQGPVPPRVSRHSSPGCLLAGSLSPGPVIAKAVVESVIPQLDPGKRASGACDVIY